MDTSSHNLDRLGIAFDDPHAEANAGLLLPATLVQKVCLKKLIESYLDLGTAPGRGLMWMTRV